MSDNTETNQQSDRIEALLKEIGELKTAREKENEELASLRQDVMRLALAPTPQTQDKGPSAPDYSNLPDRHTDYDAYERARDAALIKYITENQGKTASQLMSREQKNNELWKDFQNKYPDLAKDQEKVEFAVKKAMEKSQAKGYDMEKYMYGHPDMFFEDVVSEHNRVFGATTQKEEKTVPEKKEQTQQDEDPEGENSVWGIFGGAERTGTKKGEEEETLGSLTADIRKLQKDGGISW